MCEPWYDTIGPNETYVIEDMMKFFPENEDIVRTVVKTYDSQFGSHKGYSSTTRNEIYKKIKNLFN